MASLGSLPFLLEAKAESSVLFYCSKSQNRPKFTFSTYRPKNSHTLAVSSDGFSLRFKPVRATGEGSEPDGDEPEDELQSTIEKSKKVLAMQRDLLQQCWVRKVVNPIQEESQRKEILFAMIDMKLVSRVLHMSLVSSSQLQWCQEKLDNINFIEGKIIRACISGPLFPP